MMTDFHPIAIVGIGGIFPDAKDLKHFWSNILKGISAAREVPEGRWPLFPEQAYNPVKGTPDKVYSKRGCFIHGDPPELISNHLRISPDLLNQLDPLFHLLLYAGSQAYADANTKDLDKRRVGVIIGNIVLPSEKASALAVEVLGRTFEEKVLGTPALEGPNPVHPLNRYEAGLPAGLLAQALGLGNGSFTLDAACASSLYALKLAADELLSGRADAMLTGGLSRPDCLYTQMGFSQLRALSPSGVCSPFDKNGDGLVVGEGAGIFVLKRTEDALRDGDHIYGVISGIGLSNDIGGSLLAPDSEGQLRAMRPAYEAAGWSPQDVDLIECHATGTPVGDRVEFESLKTLWGDHGWSPGQCIIGSVKSNIGHLLTAAGSAALIKVILALKNKTLPPTANFSAPHTDLQMDSCPFRILTQPRPWPRRSKNIPRRAAVSAFGFGGVNAHVLMEEWMPQKESRIIDLGRAKKKAASPKPKIAIVGMDACFGPWNGLNQFKERVLGRSESIEPEPMHNGWGVEESIWFKGRGLGHFPFKGYALKELSVPLNEFRIPPKELEEMLPQQSLMLQVAGRAILHAGLADKDRTHTAVLIGIGLDLNTTHFQLRWWIPEKAKAWAQQLGVNLSEDEMNQWIRALRDATGHPLTANRTMGALGGIVASRIAREFRIGGPSFTISSEESSGIRALESAVHLLETGLVNHAVVGAVDLAGDIRSVLATHFGRPFSSSGKIRPFDAHGDGTILGEGAAAVVLKRLDQAVHEKNRIYGIIKGIGVAHGTDKNPLVPHWKTCRTAIKKAYENAGIDPENVDYVEAHGSGYSNEDQMELQALQTIFPSAQSKGPLPLGSVKTDIGHTGAASGMASLVKLCICLEQKILPPIRYPDPKPGKGLLDTGFFSPSGPQYWLKNRDQGPRIAALNCFSVDGNCTHVVMEAFEDKDKSFKNAHPPLGKRNAALFAVEGDTVSGILEELENLKGHIQQFPDCSLEVLAGKWWMKHRPDPQKGLCLSFMPQGGDALLSILDAAKKSLHDAPDSRICPLPNLPVAYSPHPLGKDGKIAFVFPGSGNHFPGMGRALSAQWPEIFQKQNRQNMSLSSQFVPELFWNPKDDVPDDIDPRSAIFGQVALGTAVSDLIQLFGIRPDGAIGYSLGESAALFALGAWADRDGMLHRMNQSRLFTHDLAGPCHAARTTWNLSKSEAVDWVSGVVDRPEEDVKKALKDRQRVYLLIVNTRSECVIGGQRNEVEDVAGQMGCRFFPLSGVTTVHCEVAGIVKNPYHELHLFEASPPTDVQFYSCAWEKAYEINRKSAADSILAQALSTIRFPNVIDRAYEDGIRMFLEIGPGNSCTRMIGNILNDRPHAAMSACATGHDDAPAILRVLGQMLSERVSVDLDPLYADKSLGIDPPKAAPESRIVIPIGGKPFQIPRISNAKISGLDMGKTEKEKAQVREPVSPLPAPSFEPAIAQSMSPVLRQMEAAEAAGIAAHEEYLRLSHQMNQSLSQNLAFQMKLIQAIKSLTKDQVTQISGPAIAFDRKMCMEFAVGSIARVLGSEFNPIDSHPTRVRLPDEPLMLVDRIMTVEGEPRSLGSGRVVTEHDIRKGAWYLDHDRIPTCIAVEAGQADLFLSGYLGIDFETQGLAVYRLLDAEVTFLRELPGPGSVIRYDIRIERFFRQGETYLFNFNFECTVDGQPLLSMKNGCAGFFTSKQLAAGQGIVHTDLDLRPSPGKKPNDWLDFVPMAIETFDDDHVNALRAGDLAGCFGPLFENLPLNNSMGIPGGKMALVDRVVHLDPKGGRFNLGLIRAEADIHPNDWFLTCHFIDDRVMPGTLMYECCLHTLRIFLLRMGWVGEKDQVVCGPVPGIAGKLKCRGQVLETTQTAVYEVAVKELGYRPEPYAIVDALMFADGKPIVEIRDMSICFTGLSKESILAVWEERNRPVDPAPDAVDPGKKPLYDHDRILAFAVGKPSHAFGPSYAVFDHDRIIARLPGPPYQFLDRITFVRAEPWEMKAGGVIEAEYDVPPDAWYFKAGGMPDLPEMPFAVLLEAALQPCGWFAAYMGSALTSDIDLSFRNLGGTAVLHEPVLPGAGTLLTRVKVTQVSTSAGMIIQNYDFEVRNQGRLVYGGNTAFGFFTKQALTDQKGIRDATPHEPSSTEIEKGFQFRYPEGPVFPNTQLRMVDHIECFIPDGGPVGLGFIQGTKPVNPQEWFFKAHFFQDPVWPGSLGLEAFVQLLRVVAVNRWGVRRDNPRDLGADDKIRGFTMKPGEEHRWLYRGQVIPSDQSVTIQTLVTSIDDENKSVKADGFLMVDGRVIYRMEDFVVQARM